MLCTRMRLTERRYRIKSSISYQNGDGEYESRATLSSESKPFVRPCAIIKMFECDNADAKESINSGRSTSAYKLKSDINRRMNDTQPMNKTDIHGSQTTLDRLDDETSHRRHNECISASYRAPLIVVTLFLPSEAKTLAPVDVKRDLRRPPSFCQKFQRNSPGKQCKCKINAKPDLMLRGIEITETSSNLCTSPANQDSDDILRSDHKTSDECLACTACVLENEAATPSPCVDETALDTANDQYHMDSYGNLKKNLNISGNEDIDGENDDSPECMTPVKSTPGSPDTSRIIRITLNNKNSIDSNKQSSDEDRNVVTRDIKTATF